MTSSEIKREAIRIPNQTKKVNPHTKTKNSKHNKLRKNQQPCDCHNQLQIQFLNKLQKRTNTK